jgi:sugar lactone lactonase YvrE
MRLYRITPLFVSSVLATGALAAFPTAARADTPPRVTPNSLITTIAGTGEAGFSGDGGPATEATFVQPRDTAVGPDGSIYVTDTRNNVVRVISPDGTISTFAGTGEPGYAGDGGPANEALLTWPHDVTVDEAGNVYIADSNNSAIRMVDAAGIITTIAGTGENGFNGDGLPALETQLKLPKSVAWYDGDLYFADSLNHRIRKVDSPEGTVTTVAGIGEQGYGGDGGPATAALLNTPQRIDLDSDGNIYLADTKNNRIRMIAASTGVITTVVGTGEAGYGGDDALAVDALIDTPRGIALADDGNLFVADSGNHRVRRVNLVNGNIYTVVGTGEAGYDGDGATAAAARVQGPRGLTITDDRRLIIADTINNVIRMVTPCEDFWCGNPPGPDGLD